MLIGIFNKLFKLKTWLLLVILLVVYKKKFTFESTFISICVW